MKKFHRIAGLASLGLLALLGQALVAKPVDTGVTTELPPITAPAKDCAMLSAVASEAKGDVPMIVGKVISTDADNSYASGDAMVLKKKGHTLSSTTFEFAIGSQIKPARYAVWTRFSAGGVDIQQFAIAAGPDGDHVTQRLAFSQSNIKSWEMAWRQAPGSVTVYPGDQLVRCTISGAATQQKNISGILLVPLQSIPADMDEKGAALRAAIDALPMPELANIAQRIDILEAGDSRPADPIFAGLGTVANEQKLTQTAITHFYGDDAADLAKKLNIALPAVVVMDPYFTVHGMLSRPASADEVANFVSHLPAFTPAAPVAINSQVAGQPLVEGHIAQWATIGTWSGPGGLSLWGIDAEKDVRPSIGDPNVVMNFDAGKVGYWALQPADGQGLLVVDTATNDTMWAHGSAYAHVYLHADRETPVVFHLAHNGIDSRAWLDGEPLVLANDPHPIKVSAQLASTQPLDAGVTDQGNKLDVDALHGEAPQAASFTLQPGWHRLLVKLIVQTRKGSVIKMATALTSPADEPLADIATAVSDPAVAESVHAQAAAMTPLVFTDAPFNLVDPGSAVKLHIQLHWGRVKGQPDRPAAPFVPFAATLRTTVTDYDGNEIERHDSPIACPGDLSLPISHQLPPGYYGIQMELLDGNGTTLARYMPDGFSVIGGTAAQRQRQAEKKVAVTYYFMAKQYNTLFFPYMVRMGIYRNVGGHNGRALPMYQEAARQHIDLACDLWTDHDPDYLRAYVTETAPYVDVYKAMNEIDIRPDKKGTPEYWVAKEKFEYELVHQVDPTAIYIGASLVRVGNDPWFEKCLQLGIDRYHDAWDVHAYPNKMPPLEGMIANSPNESEAGLLAVYKRLGKTNDKPFWLGETGARSSHGLDARRWQAESVAKLVAWVNSRSNFRVIGFLVPWHYSRQSPMADIGDIEMGHMPAEAALYTANALIDGFAYRRVDETDADLQAAWFGPTLMAWSMNEPKTAKFKLDGDGPWISVDVVGRTSPISPDADGNITLKISKSPQYVLRKADYDRLVAAGQDPAH